MEKKKTESLSQFSLTDFLAYLFPGAAGLVALVIIAGDTETGKNILGKAMLLGNVVAGLFGIAVSYVLGILFSSINHVLQIEKKVENSWGTKSLYENKHLEHLKSELKQAVDYFQGSQQTADKIVMQTKEGSQPNMQTKDNDGNLFYFLRAIVRAEDARTTALAERQSSLRQIRRNLLIPLMLWLVAFYPRCSTSGSFIWVALFVIISCVGIVSGLKRNREFEVRDYCLGAWWLYRKDILGEKHSGHEESSKPEKTC